MRKLTQAALSLAIMINSYGCALEGEEIASNDEGLERAELEIPTQDGDDNPVEVAFTDGGCLGDYPIRSCISGSGQYLIGDFYMNATPDSSRYWAQMEIRTTNVGSNWGPIYRLDRTGRFGPDSKNWTTLPPSHGSGWNIVRIYTWDWRLHSWHQSKQINF